MKKILNKLLPIVIIILYSACSFEFSEDYYKEIELIEPTYSVEFENFTNRETLTDSKLISFSFKPTQGNQLFNINIFLDGNQVKSTANYTGDYFIKIDDLDDGNHTLDFQYNLKSGSGSLADTFNLEGYQFTENYTFKVDKSIEIIEVSKVEHKEGSIFVYWDVPEDLKKYKEANLLIKQSYRTTRVPLLDTDSLIKKGVFRDSISLKFNIKYKIQVANNHTEKESTENNFFVTDSLITIKHEFLNDTSYKLTWNKHPLYGNFENYILSNSLGETQVDNKGGELIVNTNFVLGLVHYYSFEPQREAYIFDNKTYYGNVNFGTKYDNQQYNNLIYDKNSGYMYASNIDNNYPYKIGVFKLNSDDLSIVSKIEIDSNFGHFTPALIFDDNSNLILDMKLKSIVISKDNLSILKEYDPKEYLVDELPSNSYYRNGLLFITYTDDFNNIYVYNATTKQFITSLQRQFSEVFSSYKYFTIDRNIYKIENNNIKLLHSLTENWPRVYGLEYLKETNKLILQIGGYGGGNGRDCVFFNLNNNTTSIIPGTEQTSSFNFDSATNKILFLKSNSSGFSKASVLNLNTNQMKTLDVAGNGYGRKYVFLNDYLILLKFDYFLKNRF